MNKFPLEKFSLMLMVSCLFLRIETMWAQEVSFHAQGSGFIPLIVSATTEKEKAGFPLAKAVSGATVKLKDPKAKSKYTDGLFRINGSKNVSGEFLYKDRKTDDAGFALLYFPSRWLMYNTGSFVYLFGHVIVSAEGYDPVEIDISKALKNYPDRQSLSSVNNSASPTIQVKLKPTKSK